jgi:hypothetical protein
VVENNQQNEGDALKETSVPIANTHEENTQDSDNPSGMMTSQRWRKLPMPLSRETLEEDQSRSVTRRDIDRTISSNTRVYSCTAVRVTVISVRYTMNPRGLKLHAAQ